MSHFPRWAVLSILSGRPGDVARWDIIVTPRVSAAKERNLQPFALVDKVMLVPCCTLLPTVGFGFQPPTLTLEYKTLERSARTSTMGSAKIQLKGNEIFGQLTREQSHAFWSYDGQFSHEYVQGAQASSRLGFNCFQIVPAITFATNEYGPIYVLGPEKYREVLKTIDEKSVPESVVALLNNPGKFNATLPMGNGFCAPAMITSQGKGSSRTITMRVGTETHPSFRIVYSKFRQVGKHWVPSRIEMKYYEQVIPKNLGNVVSTAQYHLISGSESTKTQFHRIDEFFAPQTSVAFSRKHGESKTITYTRGKTSLKARLQAALAMQ